MELLYRLYCILYKFLKRKFQTNNLTMSNITSFVVTAPKEIKQKLEENIFYLPFGIKLESKL